MLAVMFGHAGRQPIGLYSTRNWTKIADIPHSGQLEPSVDPRAFSFSPDGRILAVATAQDVLIYDVSERRLTKRINTLDLRSDGCCLSEVAFSPDASEVAVGMYVLPTMTSSGWRIPQLPCAFFGSRMLRW
jgi:WD40 repeat protein